MKPKTIIAALLLTFVFGSVAYMAVRGPGSSRAEPASTLAADKLFATVEGVEPDVIIYFFYNDIRCSVCLKLEEYAREILKSEFADDLTSGRLQWRALSMDAPENEHYLTEYRLYSKSLVLVEMENGEEVRSKNLEEIWDLVYDKPGYMKYMRTNLHDFIGVAE